MSPLEAIEHRLATALAALDSAAGFVRQANELDDRANLRHIGTAINATWELRETIHTKRPELRPGFVVEEGEDPDRFELLGRVARAADELERAGDFAAAAKQYQELLVRSAYGHWELVAQAGLYRTQQQAAL